MVLIIYPVHYYRYQLVMYICCVYVCMLCAAWVSLDSLCICDYIYVLCMYTHTQFQILANYLHFFCSICMLLPMILYHYSYTQNIRTCIFKVYNSLQVCMYYYYQLCTQSIISYKLCSLLPLPLSKLCILLMGRLLPKKPTQYFNNKYQLNFCSCKKPT